MTQHVTAIFENGVLKPLAPLDLREHEFVSLSVEKVVNPPEEEQEEGPTLFDVFEKAGLIGCADDLPADLSTNPKYMEGFGKSGQ